MQELLEADVEMRTSLTRIIMVAPAVMAVELAEVEEIREAAVAVARLSANSSLVVFLTPPKIRILKITLVNTAT